MLLGMNRLRSAYVELDPIVERYLVTSRHDDPAGLMASYLMGNRRSTFSHIVASTGMFINVVNGLVAGTLGALVAAAADAPPWLIAVIGTASGLAYNGAAVEIFSRMFSDSRIQSRFPTPAAPTGG